jgi:uncharacterized protein (UPF0335 family)
MTKALKFDDASVAADEAPRRIPNTAEVKSFIDRITKVMETMDDCKADLKSLYGDAADQGINKKALKIVVQYKKRGISDELKHDVNELLEKSGGQMMFAFT